MGLHELIALLGEEILDVDEETFLLFSQPIVNQNLGFIDSKATILELTVGNRDLSVVQSPGLLSSNRQQGTTGAVVWKVTPIFAEWLIREDNLLRRAGLLRPDSVALELGCGISGIIPLVLAPKIGKYIATDQEYVFKMLKQNLSENISLTKEKGSKKQQRSQNKPSELCLDASIDVLALDWEESMASSISFHLPNGAGIDLILACDCIYNESLIDPFVNTCADICRLNASSCACVIAQQIRSDIIFQAWLTAALKLFRVWRVEDFSTGIDQSEGAAFTVHIAVLRDATEVTS